jgi:hypothetical protein
VAKEVPRSITITVTITITITMTVTIAIGGSPVLWVEEGCRLAWKAAVVNRVLRHTGVIRVVAWV